MNIIVQCNRLPVTYTWNGHQCNYEMKPSHFYIHSNTYCICVNYNCNCSDQPVVMLGTNHCIYIVNLTLCSYCMCVCVMNTSAMSHALISPRPMPCKPSKYMSLLKQKELLLMSLDSNTCTYASQNNVTLCPIPHVCLFSVHFTFGNHIYVATGEQQWRNNHFQQPSKVVNN